jgi:DNA-binding beta-propeller fold protein YncE
MTRAVAGAISIFAGILVVLVTPVTVRAASATSPGAAPRPGDIFVADQSAAGGTGAVIRIDPVTGKQKSVASGNLLMHPAGITVSRDGTIFVAVPQTPGERPGRIVKIDVVTGAQESVSSGGMLACPTGVASAPDGDLIVADPCAKKVIKIDQHGRAQKVISAGGKLAFPQGVRVAADGSIVLADRDAGGGAGAIIRVDPKTGAQTVISSGENLLNPTDLALDATRKILVADFNSFACGPGGYAGTGAGAILRLDPPVDPRPVDSRSADRPDGAAAHAGTHPSSQSLVSCDHLFGSKGPYGITTEANGNLLVTATSGDANPAGAPRPTPGYSYAAARRDHPHRPAERDPNQSVGGGPARRAGQYRCHAALKTAEHKSRIRVANAGELFRLVGDQL